jgi:hypothetical protein
MGAVSAEKKQYDQLTVEYFESSNSSEPSWSAYSVRRRGRFCDVVAINSDSIAVIEVKSPKEKSCDSSYNDAVHMCKELMPPDFPTRRRGLIRIANDLPRKGRALVKLYLVTIGCQLFRYCLEFEQKKHFYQAIIGSKLQESFSFPGSHLIRAFLVVPSENHPHLQKALDLSKENQIIESCDLKPSADQLCVAEIKYSPN